MLQMKIDLGILKMGMSGKNKTVFVLIGFGSIIGLLVWILRRPNEKAKNKKEKRSWAETYNETTYEELHER